MTIRVVGMVFKGTFGFRGKYSVRGMLKKDGQNKLFSGKIIEKEDELYTKFQIIWNSESDDNAEGYYFDSEGETKEWKWENGLLFSQTIRNILIVDVIVLILF